MRNLRRRSSPAAHWANTWYASSESGTPPGTQAPSNTARWATPPRWGSCSTRTGASSARCLPPCSSSRAVYSLAATTRSGFASCTTDATCSKISSPSSAVLLPQQVRTHESPALQHGPLDDSPTCPGGVHRASRRGRAVLLHLGLVDKLGGSPPDPADLRRHRRRDPATRTALRF